MGDLLFLHLVTVGTSVVRNAYRFSKDYSILEKHVERLKNWSHAGPDTFWDKDAGEHARVSSDVFKDVLAFVSSNPRMASAELNSFLGYIDYLVDKGISDVVHDVVLYPTDTGTSLFCARVVKEYLEINGLNALRDKNHRLGKIEIETVPGFGKNFWRGLLGLVEKIGERIIKSKNYDRILANLTAGFKPESSFLLLVSSILGVDTAYYIHEYMKNIVEIPVLELQLTPNMEKILEQILATKTKPLPQNIAKITDRLGLTINGKPLPETHKLAKILLRYRRRQG